MSVGNNFDPDLQYLVVWSGGELLPPRSERTSSSWATNEERRDYNQTGNHRTIFTPNFPRPTLPSIGEDQIDQDPEGDEINLQDLLNIEKALKS